MTVEIQPLTGEPAVIERLADILIATVAAGGSVHFMHPVPREAAVAYWREALADPGRVVLGGYLSAHGGTRDLVGTVTLWHATPPNQPFRAEIWKLMTDPAARRLGVARALMVAAEQLAVERGKTLLNLDTAADHGAAPLYDALGWTRVGAIPDYAYTPHGGLTATILYYKQLAPAPPSPGRAKPDEARQRRGAAEQRSEERTE
jgi:ribosomal protein S18 acetylase RimI-like enzyme